MPDYTLPRLRLRWALLLSLAIIAATAGILLWMGRNPICPCGYISLRPVGKNEPWISQHLLDWYTYSHVVHGVVFYFLLWLALRGRLSIAARLVIAVLIEGVWESIENSAFIINRYRVHTISQSYDGDSIVNSVADMLAMLVGFFLSARLPPWVTIVFVIAVEVLMLAVMRDNLLLNVIMLLYPMESIRLWQAGT
jgi:hypothetical protein